METVQSTVPEQVDNSPEGMIMAALNKGRSMEEIGQLIQYRNDELKRLARLEFFQAKKNFSALRGRIVKSNSADYGETKTGRQGAKYFYEDLDAVERVVKEPAAECGLSYDWKTRYDGNFIYIKCILTHTSGHFEEVEMRGSADQSGGKNSIQAEASTVSYLMRYTLKQVLGLSTGKDDNDGKNGAKNQVEFKIANLSEPDPQIFKSLCYSVSEGTMTIEQIQKTYIISEERLETLKTLKP